MDLACPSQEVSFLVGAVVPAVFVAEAFDAGGTRLAEAGVQIAPDLRQVTLRARSGLITRVAYETFPPDEVAGAPAFAIDSLVVPEADAALGALAAVAGLGALRGRRRARR